MLFAGSNPKNGEFRQGLPLGLAGVRAMTGRCTSCLMPPRGATSLTPIVPPATAAKLQLFAGGGQLSKSSTNNADPGFPLRTAATESNSIMPHANIDVRVQSNAGPMLGVQMIVRLNGAPIHKTERRGRRRSLGKLHARLGAGHPTPFALHGLVRSGYQRRQCDQRAIIRRPHYRFVRPHIGNAIGPRRDSVKPSHGIALPPPLGHRLTAGALFA